MIIDENNGFTIIEVTIVLVLASLILIIVFLAVPALQRNYRNHKRDADAAALTDAIEQCLIANNYRAVACDSPAEIAPFAPQFSQISTYHYGSNLPANASQVNAQQLPPKLDDPNWLFFLDCNAQLTWFTNIGTASGFVVTYYREGPNGSTPSRCIQGSTTAS